MLHATQAAPKFPQVRGLALWHCPVESQQPLAQEVESHFTGALQATNETAARTARARIMPLLNTIGPSPQPSPPKGEEGDRVDPNG